MDGFIGDNDYKMGGLIGDSGDQGVGAVSRMSVTPVTFKTFNIYRYERHYPDGTKKIDGYGIPTYEYPFVKPTEQEIRKLFADNIAKFRNHTPMTAPYSTSEKNWTAYAFLIGTVSTKPTIKI